MAWTKIDRNNQKESPWAFGIIRQNIYVGLVHNPVYNKFGDVVTTSITNLDIHDIARCAKTYGINKYYLVTPLEEQKVLINRIIDHWTTGYGATYNSDRQKALKLVGIKNDLEACVDEIEKKMARNQKL